MDTAFELRTDGSLGPIEEFLGAVHFDDERAMVALALWPPLDLGLTLSTTKLEPEQQRVRYRQRGGPSPEQLFLAADEVERARQLLTPSLESATFADPAVGVFVLDSWVVAERRAEVDSELRSTIDSALAVARAVESLRPSVAPPLEVATVGDSWRQVAERRRYLQTSLPFGFVGTECDVQVRAFTRRLAKGKLAACAFASFRARLDIGFRVQSRGELRDSPSGMAPVYTEDPELDRLFETDAASERVKGILRPELRARLVQLHRSGLHVHLDDHGVLLDAGRLVEGEQTERMLDDAMSAAELVDGDEKRGAYR